jgi:hypothetical protein
MFMRIFVGQFIRNIFVVRFAHLNKPEDGTLVVKIFVGGFENS